MGVNKSEFIHEEKEREACLMCSASLPITDHNCREVFRQCLIVKYMKVSGSADSPTVKELTDAGVDVSKMPDNCPNGFAKRMVAMVVG